MKIEIEIPNPKFEVGDFIRYTEKGGLSGFLVIARIQDIRLEGIWGYHSGQKPWMDIEDSHYEVVVQEGSLTPEKTPLRPGTLLCPHYLDVHTYAEKIEYAGKVWEGDTIYNINERI